MAHEKARAGSVPSGRRVRPPDNIGRPMRGWVLAGEVLDDEVLERWFDEARGCGATLSRR